jgi:hypothetical protein
MNDSLSAGAVGGISHDEQTENIRQEENPASLHWAV